MCHFFFYFQIHWTLLYAPRPDCQIHHHSLRLCPKSVTTPFIVHYIVTTPFCSAVRMSSGKYYTLYQGYSNTNLKGPHIFFQWLKGPCIEVGQATCNNTVIFKTKCPFHSKNNKQQNSKIKCCFNFSIDWITQLNISSFCLPSNIVSLQSCIILFNCVIDVIRFLLAAWYDDFSAFICVVVTSEFWGNISSKFLCFVS